MLSKSDEIGRLMAKCLSCGKCSPYCPVSLLGLFDPHELMVSGEGDVSECVQCGTCSRICRRSDPFKVIRMMLCEGQASVPGPGRLADCDMAIVPGCTVRERIPRLADSTASVLRMLGYDPAVMEGDVCCLRPSRYGLLTDMERKAAIASELSCAEGIRKVSPCPECAEEFGEGVDQLLDVLLEKAGSLPSSETDMRVTVFTGCALSSRKKDIASLMSRLGLSNVVISTDCCGRDSGNSEIMEERLKECDGSPYAVTFCPRCTLNYSEHLPALHITELIQRLSEGGLEERAPYACPYGSKLPGRSMTRW